MATKKTENKSEAKAEEKVELVPVQVDEHTVCGMTPEKAKAFEAAREADD